MASETDCSTKAKYFVAKCANVDSLRRCVSSGKWASRGRLIPPQPHDVLSSAFKQGLVILIFSVNNCHGWHGYCRMTSPPDCPDQDQASTPDDVSTECDIRTDTRTSGSLENKEQSLTNTVVEEVLEKDRLGLQGCPTSSDCDKADSETSLGENKRIISKEEPILSQNYNPKHQNSFSASVDNSDNARCVSDTSGQAVNSTNNNISNNTTLTNNSQGSSQNEKADAWHYFNVDWQIEFMTKFGEVCLPSSTTATCLLLDGSPLNKARNWQELPADVGIQVCSLLSEMHEGLMEKRRASEAAKLAAKPAPFITVEGDEQPDYQLYWRNIIEKVERELGRVHLACPFGSQRYNLHQRDSDIDAFIVYQAHTKDLLGFSPPKHTVKNSDRETCDYTVLELKRYCDLLLAYDARCIETLFLHESTVVQASDDWRKLQTLRQQFLTRKCLDKYMGEALGSNGVQKFYRSIVNEQLSGEQSPSPRVSKLLYIIVRLLQNTLHIVKGGPLQVFRPSGSEERTTLLRIRNSDVSIDEAKATIQGLEKEIGEGKDRVVQELTSTKDDLESWLLDLRHQDFQMHPPVLSQTA